MTAIELALGTRLKQLAAQFGIATTRADGGPLPFSRLNNDLCTAGAYDETDRAQIEAWFKLRNDAAHATTSDARIEAVNRRCPRLHRRPPGMIHADPLG